MMHWPLPFIHLDFHGGHTLNRSLAVVHIACLHILLLNISTELLVESAASKTIKVTIKNCLVCSLCSEVSANNGNAVVDLV